MSFAACYFPYQKCLLEAMLPCPTLGERRHQEKRWWDVLVWVSHGCSSSTLSYMKLFEVLSLHLSLLSVFFYLSFIDLFQRKRADCSLDKAPSCNMCILCLELRLSMWYRQLSTGNKAETNAWLHAGHLASDSHPSFCSPIIWVYGYS